MSHGAHPWGQFGHDAQHSGRGVAEGPLTLPFIAWQSAGATAFSSAVVSAEKAVFSVVYGCTFAYDAATGAVRWNACRDPGPAYSSPALSLNGGRLYVASYGNASLSAGNASLSALNSTDGAVLWVHPLGGHATGSPSVSYAGDGSVYVGSYGGVLYSFRPSGLLNWRFDAGGAAILSTPALAIRSAQGSTPTGAVYLASTSGSLFALDAATGAQLWRTSAWGAGGPTALAVQSSPTLSDDASRIFIGTWDGALLCFAAESGAVLWRFNAAAELRVPTPAIVATPALSPPGWGGASLVYVGTAYSDAVTSAAHGTLFAVYTSNGSLAWATPVGCDVITAPVVGASGVLFIGLDDADGVDTGGGGIAAFDGAGGAPLWTMPLGEAVFAAPTLGADGTLYVGGSSGAFYALAAPSVAPSALPSPQPPTAPLPVGAAVALSVLGGVLLAGALLAAVAFGRGWRPAGSCNLKKRWAARADTRLEAYSALDPGAGRDSEAA